MRTKIIVSNNTIGQRLLYCDVESKWKNYHIITFPGQSLSKTLEEAVDLSLTSQVIYESQSTQRNNQ
jgi:hypothetical protein